MSMTERRKFRRKKRPEQEAPQSAPRGVLPSRLPEPVPPAVQHNPVAKAETQPAKPPLDEPRAPTVHSPALRAQRDSVADTWAQLDSFSLDMDLLERNRIITANRIDPAYTAFDVLRTRLLQALPENGWTRIAITSPTKGCGKTFTAANLAISLARQDKCRTLLIDLDMRRPSLHKVFGVTQPGRIGDLLRGHVTARDHLLRPATGQLHGGHNIAFGFNDAAEDYAAELLQDPATGAALQQMQQALKPNVMLFDMPPALLSDDVIAFRAHFDAVLLIVGGGLTTDAEVKEVERRLGAQTPLLGMVLNKADGASSRKYAY